MSGQASGCAELAEMGLMGVTACCEACHSVEDYAPGFVLGPCRAVLPGGEEAFVCCSSRARLLGIAGVAHGETQRR